MTKGERIRELRTKAGLSQVELANKISVSKQTLYKYENDIVTNIPSTKIEIMARILNTTPEYIMGWDTVQTSGQSEQYYDDTTLAEAQELFDNPDLHALMDAARDCKPEYIKSAVQLLKTLKETNTDG